MPRVALTRITSLTLYSFCALGARCRAACRPVGLNLLERAVHSPERIQATCCRKNCRRTSSRTTDRYRSSPRDCCCLPRATTSIRPVPGDVAAGDEVRTPPREFQLDHPACGFSLLPYYVSVCARRSVEERVTMGAAATSALQVCQICMGLLLVR